MMGELDKAGRRGTGSRTINAMIPTDHLLRRVDRLLDIVELRAALAPHYSRCGRPSVDPELLVRMMLIGRIYAISSERRLCEELRYNLAYRWFCRLAPAATVPHHSTFSKNRHGRFRDAGIFRVIFEATVKRCIAKGLVAGKDAAIDASFIAADASWQRKMRPVDIAGHSEPLSLMRPVREWLADSASAPRSDIGAPRGAPASLSRTDPGAAWSSRTVRGRFGYSLNVLIDTPSGITLEVQATPARHGSEVDAARDMLARAGDRFDFRPKRVAADTAYGSAVFLAFVRDQGALPHIPVLERSEQTNGMFPREAFTFNREGDYFTCPAGKVLPYRAFEKPTGIRRYRAFTADCRPCPLRQKCTTAPFRSVGRMQDEDVRDLVRAESRTGLFKRSVRLRCGVERLFADAKSRRGLSRLHLRGLRGAEEEFLITATVLNLLVLARPSQKLKRSRRVPTAPVRISNMAKITQSRFQFAA